LSIAKHFHPRKEKVDAVLAEKKNTGPK